VTKSGKKSGGFQIAQRSSDRAFPETFSRKKQEPERRSLSISDVDVELVMRRDRPFISPIKGGGIFLATARRGARDFAREEEVWQKLLKSLK
jgi:hypothetical protein